MVVGLIGISMPVFWLGEVVNLLSQSRLHDTFLFSWVPPLGYTPFSESPIGWFKSLLLPWLTLSVLYIGVYARVLRSSLIEAQEEDYVRTARAKGLSEQRVLLRHALRTSLIAFVSLFGLDFGALVGGGALLTEVVFGLPGVGKLTYDSLQNLDLPVIMANRDLCRVLRRRSPTRSSTCSTPGSTRGCAMPEATLLDVRDLSVSFRTEDGVVRAVDGLSLSLGQGEVARHRRRVRVREDRLDAERDAPDPRPERDRRGSGSLPRPGPDDALAAGDAVRQRARRSR